MSLKPLVRTYHFEDAELIQEAGRIKNAAERDLTDFTKRNVTNTTLKDFQGFIDDFDNFPTDDELEGIVITATNDKNKMAENIRVQVRSIRNMAQLQYGSNGMYKTFGFAGMDDMDDAGLYRLAKRVVRVGTKQFTDLAKQGLTQEMLDTLQQTAIDFDSAIDKQDDEIENRDIQTQQRVMLGNNLYAELVKLASIGKSLYEDSDEAKYNDYVLYDEPKKVKTTDVSDK